MAEEIRKVLPDTESRARKRSCQPEQWKREKAKVARYSPKGLPEFPHCSHRSKKAAFLCWSLTMNDIKHFHSRFYSSKKKTEQDAFILCYCSAVQPARKRARGGVISKSKAVSLTYKVQKPDGTLIQVCREAFLGILGISKDRILRLVKKFINTGKMPKENRGGDRVKIKNDQKKLNNTFIELLRCTESHYCRSDSPHRVYLPCDLSIKKLWKIYNEQTEPDLKVKQCFFRNYFNKHYNIGFGTPQTDLCSACLQYKVKIKISSDPATKQSFITNYKVHKLQANSFYALLKQSHLEVVNFSFDCEENPPLPKLPDKQAYFSIQLNYYILGVVMGNSKVALSPNNVMCYVWSEVDRPKGSNEIASAIHHTLSQYEFQPNHKIVRLFCDGCGGQNKNSIFIGMLCNWFTCSAPPNIKEIQVIFPVVGHSFMPPGRVFGNIEKVVRKTSEIIQPDHYMDIIKVRAKVLQIDVDFQVFDWKTESQRILKPTTQRHFKFKPTKRFILTKNKSGMVLVRGEAVYRSDLGEAKGIYRKGKQVETMPTELPIGIGIKDDKEKSIANLLKTHYGEDWKSNPSLQYFKNIFENNLHNTETLDGAVENENNDEELNI